MIRTVFVLIIALAFSLTVNAQTKSITGKVVGGEDCTMRGWCYITVQSGEKEYSILVGAGAFAVGDQLRDGSFPKAPANPKIVGNISEGRMVRVFYVRDPFRGKFGDLRATRIVEIKKSGRKR